MTRSTFLARQPVLRFGLLFCWFAFVFSVPDVVSAEFFEPFNGSFSNTWTADPNGLPGEFVWADLPFGTVVYQGAPLGGFQVVDGAEVYRHEGNMFGQDNIPACASRFWLGIWFRFEKAQIRSGFRFRCAEQ